MSIRWICVLLSGCLLMLAAAPGTVADPADVKPAPAGQQVGNHVDYTGRTEAVATVELRARVSGYLTRVVFKDGAEVRQGDLLFEIDPRPYQAELDRASAAVDVTEAQLKRAQADVARGKALLDRAAIAKEEYDKLLGEIAVAEAGVKAARASREVAALNLEWTKVTAPIAGRISRHLVDPGNVVKADDTVLARIVSTDPMYVYFDMDERTYLNLRQAILHDKLRPAGGTELPVAIGLANEDGFPRKGKIDYVHNQVDVNTGAVRMRAVLPNTDGLLVPGLFARVRVTLAPEKK
jgi:multidrug efflux system membrane fusion protein